MGHKAVAVPAFDIAAIPNIASNTTVVSISLTIKASVAIVAMFMHMPWTDATLRLLFPSLASCTAP